MQEKSPASAGCQGTWVDPTDDGMRIRWVATTLFGAIAAAGAVDLALDQPTSL